MSSGLVIPEVLVDQEYKKNQIKTIKFIDLDKFHFKKPSEKVKELYENKNIFVTELKTIRYAEITPEKIN